MKGKSFIIFQFIQIVIIKVSFSVLINGCHCVPCSEKNEPQIPLEILQGADQFIISKTGDEFFKKYIIADLSQSKHISPNYLMVYKFYMPEKSFVDELIRFTVDSTGKVLTQYEVVGIPDCTANPMDCDFVVDEKIAKQIATDNGFPKGIKEWKIDFIWEAKYNKYVWHLFSTLKESQGDFGYRANGEQIVIDPNYASVIYQDSWKIN
ncbi:MAG: hypothetical protein Q8M94_02385 [Ignavibacteria bacterium]|nr:hypothetical protein [Ignavibacteria bacterium]